ncbi:hypothetical protein DRF62_19170 [Chryseobacterium piscium]|uniref:Uncharacterized protein n=1 Tax=Chryseobacterium piscium TaxID=333702 RepID=A0A3D9BAJ8_9FLAO|nr:hypothetical protein [Chryseobacterium piscium]REC50448.1 hypothetical protein DRF62_19170 [Chryseobacterium piscium]
MKNIKISHLIIINVIIGIILFFNFYSFSKDPKHIFTRNFISNSDFKFFNKTNLVKKDSTSKFLYTLNSYPFIGIYNTDKNNVHTIDFYADNNVNKKVNTTSYQSSPGESIIFSNPKEVYSIKEGSILKNHEKINFTIPFKAINLFKVNNTMICLVEINNDSLFRTCFISIDLENDEVTIISNIEDNSTSKYAENILKFSGGFYFNNNICVFLTNKSSNVWVFNYNKSFKYFNHFTTLDKTGYPTIISRENDLLYYKRGETFSTNTGVLIFDDYLSLFSCRSKEREKLIMDNYTFTGKYINSLKHNVNINSIDINKVFQKKNDISIATDQNFYLLSKVTKK